MGNKSVPKGHRGSNKTPVFNCNHCCDWNYILSGCCSGVECGCMGQPVDAAPCMKCNADEKKEPSKEAKEQYPFFFGEN